MGGSSFKLAVGIRLFKQYGNYGGCEWEVEQRAVGVIIGLCAVEFNCFGIRYVQWAFWLSAVSRRYPFFVIRLLAFRQQYPVWLELSKSG